MSKVSSCMLAQPFAPERAKYPAIVQPKFDGIRALWDPFQKKLFSRNGNQLFLPHIERELDGINYHLDGEIYLHGMDFNEISGIVRNSSKDKSKLYYVIFDYTHSSYSFEDRLAVLKERISCYDNIYLAEANMVFEKSNYEDVHRGLVLNARYEGSIFRNPEALYQFKRTFDLMKRKKKIQKSFLILSYLFGEGKYTNTLGAIKYEVDEDNAGTVGSGFTDYERYSLMEIRPPGYVVIEFQEYSYKGIPRFPVFVKISPVMTEEIITI